MPGAPGPKQGVISATQACGGIDSMRSCSEMANGSRE